MTLRANVYEQYPFKDMKGGWTVIIRFGANKFSVSHLKREQSHFGDEQYFDFEWLLKREMEYHNPATFIPVRGFPFSLSLSHSRSFLPDLLPFLFSFSPH